MISPEMLIPSSLPLLVAWSALGALEFDEIYLLLFLRLSITPFNVCSSVFHFWVRANQRLLWILLGSLQ